MNRILYSLAITPLILSSAQAQRPEPTTLPSVVVVATRVPTETKYVGSSVTVLNKADIERSQAVSLPQLLQGVPGLFLLQSGGNGGSTSMFMRGTNSNHTKVLLDGVDVNDPSTPSGTFNFEHILASDLEQIEVLRGPQSGLYGSDSLGGVINIITKKGAGKPRVNLITEGGAFNTIRQSAQVSGSHERLSYMLSADYLRVGASPVTPKTMIVPGRIKNDDTYENKTVSTNLNYKLTDDLNVGLVARFTDSEISTTSDDFFGPRSKQNRGDNAFGMVRATAHHVSFGGIFEQTFGLSHVEYRRFSFSPTASALVEPALYTGQRDVYDWQGTVKLNQDHTVVLGLEHRREGISGNQGIAASITNSAGSIGLNSKFGDRLFTSFNARLDHNENFGNKFTYRFAPSYLILETGTKLKASIGTGFKAPSLDQLFHTYYSSYNPAYNFYANPNLQPETNTGYDIGFEQRLFNDKVQFGSTYFHNSIKNLITANSAFTTSINVGQATTQGLESFVSYQPIEAFSIKTSHTYTIAENNVTDQTLLRRPKHKFGVQALWDVNVATKLSASVEHTSGWIDGNRDFSISRLQTKGFTTVNVSASHAFNKTVTAFARVENALDARYEQPTGYERPRFGAYAGLKFTLGGD